MRESLHRLGLYFGSADETFEERAEREATEARQAEMSVLALLLDSCIRGLIVGVVFAFGMSFFDGAVLTDENARDGALIVLIMTMVFWVTRLRGRARAKAAQRSR